MNRKKEWVCWRLCQEDIEYLFKKMGINSETITADQYDEIAEKFMDAFECVNNMWEEILEEAIDEVLCDKNNHEKSDQSKNVNLREFGA